VVRAGLALDPARIAGLGQDGTVARAARRIGALADGFDPQGRAPSRVA
jgi:hypothetical protein